MVFWQTGDIRGYSDARKRWAGQNGDTCGQSVKYLEVLAGNTVGGQVPLSAPEILKQLIESSYHQKQAVIRSVSHSLLRK